MKSITHHPSFRYRILLPLIIEALFAIILFFYDVFTFWTLVLWILSLPLATYNFRMIKHYGSFLNENHELLENHYVHVQNLTPKRKQTTSYQMVQVVLYFSFFVNATPKIDVTHLWSLLHFLPLLILSAILTYFLHQGAKYNVIIASDHLVMEKEIHLYKEFHDYQRISYKNESQLLYLKKEQYLIGLVLSQEQSDHIIQQISQ